MKKIIAILICLCFTLVLYSCSNDVDLSGIESKIDNIRQELQEKDLSDVIIKNDEPLSVEVKKEKYNTVFLTDDNIDKYIAINTTIQDIEIIRYEQKDSIGLVDVLYDLYMIVKVETSSRIPNCIFGGGFTSFSFQVYNDEPDWNVSNYSFSTIDSKGNSSSSFILYKVKSRYNKFLDISPVRVKIDYPSGYVEVPILE